MQNITSHCCMYTHNIESSIQMLIKYALTGPSYCTAPSCNLSISYRLIITNIFNLKDKGNLKDGQLNVLSAKPN